MQFCDDCGSLMHAAGDGTGGDPPADGSGAVMVCSSCGARESQDEGRAADFVSTEEQRFDDVIESSEEASLEGKPTTQDVTCDACGNGEAWYTLKQTASADEPPTRFFKCTDCGRRWRGYN